MNGDGLIANPNAGMGRTWAQLGNVLGVAKAAGMPCIATHHIEQLPGAVLNLLRDNGVNRIFVFGGDGTLRALTETVINLQQAGEIDRMPIFCSLGGGTMLAVHKWLGWHEKPAQILRKVSNARSVPLRKLRPLMIEYVSPDGERAVTYGFMFLLGAVARVVDLYDREGRSIPSGLKSIALAMLASLTGRPKRYAKLLPQMEGSFMADGNRLDMSRPLTAIASVNDTLIFDMKLYADQAESNQFYALLYGVTATEAAMMVPTAVRGTVIPKGRRFFNQPVFSLETTTTEEMFNLDGETVVCRPSSPISLQLGPELQLVSCF